MSLNLLNPSGKTATTPRRARRELTTYFQADDGCGFNLQPGDHIVLQTHGLPAGGAERQWVYLAQALEAFGYRVTFVTHYSLDGENAHYLSLLRRSAVRLFDLTRMDELDVFRNLPGIPNMAAMVKETRIDLIETLLRLIAAFNLLKPKAVLAQLDDSNVLSGVAARFCGIGRFVASFRNYNPSHFWFAHDSYLPCYRLLARSGAVRFSGNSSAGNNDYADWIGIPRRRVTFIPNAIDTEAFPEPADAKIQELRASLAIRKDESVLLGVFRLQPEKDPKTFIEVSRRVATAMPNVKVLLAGVGPMRSELQQLVTNIGLENRFQFLGQRTDVSVLMALADVVLLTSRREGMPNVLMEAQLMKTPVVATRAGGTPDTVIDLRTGLLRPIGHVEGLARACIDILNDKAQAIAMGLAGRRHVLASFPKELIAEHFIRLLQ